MSASFKVAFALTNRNEGAWQNDPDDSGNAPNGLGTYKGIASAKQPKWKGWKVIGAIIANQMTPQPQYGTKEYRQWVIRLNLLLAAESALQTMVEDFYRVNFWDVNSLDKIDSQNLANKVYDCGVNQGTGTAAILLQQVAGVHADGQIGPVTLAKVNKMNGDELAGMFKQARIEKYKALVAEKPTYKKYLNQWIERC